MESELGLLLPCNVIVYEDDGATHVSVIKPTEMLRIVGNAELNEIARQIETKLKRALDRV